LGILLVFKYFNFFNESITAIAEAIGWNYSINTLQLVLPVGISFYTFQTLSYTIDVYQRRIQPEKHLGIFSLFVSFFPQLVAGPIERPSNLLPQLKNKHTFDFDGFKYGLTYILWGLFKKVVIADRVAIIVNPIYNDVSSFGAPALLAATILFAFQIFCDFSGYSDIAIGSARLLGIDLMKNFDRPYFSKSISEFWRRWHISLSTWFRDYVYIPLGGSRVIKWRWYYNLFVTFLVSGLWHGAAWTFVIWGGLHGLYMVVGAITKKRRDALKAWFGIIGGSPVDTLISIFVTFSLVSFAWIFFRANDLGDAVEVIQKIARISVNEMLSLFDLTSMAKLMKTDRIELLIAIVFIVFMEVIHIERRNSIFYTKFSHLPIVMRWPAYYVLLFILLFFGVYESNEFIYFQF
jgi:D-alanyl-lipoteichoic acid acyltransferase DltB (MBOAT superfamily)